MVFVEFFVVILQLALIAWLQPGVPFFFFNYPCLGDSDLWVRKIPRSGEGNSNLLQYSCLGNPMDSGASWATVPGVAKESGMTATKEQQKQGHSKFLHFTHCMFSFNLRKNFIEHVFDCHS